MKVPITDKFLWDLYIFLEKAQDIGHVVFNPRLTMRDIHPEHPLVAQYRHMKNRRQFNWLIHYLKKKNYIKVRNLQEKKAIMLTKKGIDKALLASFKADVRPKRKDGKWIMIIFDIPQKHQKSRMMMRSVLKNLGYKMFQQSVWVTPYDIADKTETLLQHYNLDDYVKVFLIEKL